MGRLDSLVALREAKGMCSMILQGVVVRRCQTDLKAQQGTRTEDAARLVSSKKPACAAPVISPVTAMP